MKATRRQELKTNELADSLNQVRDFVQQYGTWLIAGLLALTVIIGGSSWYRQSQQQKRASVWTEMSEMAPTTQEEYRVDIDRLKAIESEIDDADIQIQTLHARALLAENQAFDDLTGDVRTEFVDEMRSAYQELLDRFSNRPVERGSALIGLCKAEEIAFLADGDLAHKTKAAGYLDRVINDKELAMTPFSSIAIGKKAIQDRTFSQVDMATSPPPAPTTPPQPPSMSEPAGVPDTPPARDDMSNSATDESAGDPGDGGMDDRGANDNGANDNGANDNGANNNGVGDDGSNAGGDENESP